LIEVEWLSPNAGQKPVEGLWGDACADRHGELANPVGFDKLLHVFYCFFGQRRVAHVGDVTPNKVCLLQFMFRNKFGRVCWGADAPMLGHAQMGDLSAFESKVHLMERTNTLNGVVAIEIVASLAQAGMTRLQLAEKTGMHVNTISRLLRNQSDIDLNVLVLISDALQVNPRDLIERAERRLIQSVN
jgi:DNA-binding Xre family transcriptional regulator